MDKIMAQGVDVIRRYRPYTQNRLVRRWSSTLPYELDSKTGFFAKLTYLRTREIRTIQAYSRLFKPIQASFFPSMGLADGNSRSIAEDDQFAGAHGDALVSVVAKFLKCGCAASADPTKSDLIQPNPTSFFGGDGSTDEKSEKLVVGSRRGDEVGRVRAYAPSHRPATSAHNRADQNELSQIKVN